MQIPKVLLVKMEGDSNLVSLVQFANSKATSHITANKPAFFLEYTDHGLEHLEDVLSTAVGLATDESIEVLTAEDSAVIILSVLLHDLGMHLTPEGFLSLVRPGSRWIGVDGLDKDPWSDLWDSFLAEAGRFDGRKLTSLFGPDYSPIRIPPADHREWEERDYLLIGEFLRRYHPRLAHEIALHGLPGIDGDAIPVCLADDEISRFITDVAGLVARSHGTDIRPMLEYLQSRYGNSVAPRRVRAAYLMVLLRIADFLQIQESRAPVGRTSVRKFTSPYSGSEWRVHQSIQDVHNSDADPEAVTVIASPSDVEAFLKLQAWTTGLQSELDKSWAILGEIFGRQDKILSSLGLKIRRIKSNIDNVDNFSRSVDYVPTRISFHSANADLLKLLVGPLYGNDVKVGFRELIQNSIDAVREYDSICKRNSSYKRISLSDSVDVKLEIIKDENGEVTKVLIEDSGVGMNLDVIQNYFLRAGASFRKSEQWKADHEDSQGKSRVLRTGRFGVGALAAFLIGDEIEVTTRHYLSSEDGALHFSARIDDDAINITKTKAPVGTSISIKVPARLAKAIKSATALNYSGDISLESGMGWYFAANPNLQRYVDGKEINVEPGVFIPTHRDESRNWRFITSKGVDIFWTYNAAPASSANGIVIDPNKYRHVRSSSIGPFYRPNVSFLDPNGIVNINLQRNWADAAPFDHDILESVVDDLICNALWFAPDRQYEGKFFYGDYVGFYRHPYIQANDSMWFLTKNGFSFSDDSIVRDLAKTNVIFGVGGQSGFRGWGANVVNGMTEGDAAFSVSADAFSSGGNKRKSFLLDAMTSPPGSRVVRAWPRKLAVPQEVVRVINSYQPGKNLRQELSKLRPQDDGVWHCYGDGQVSRLTAAATSDYTRWSELGLIVFSEGQVRPTPLDDTKDLSPVARRWLKAIGTYVIPYEFEEREHLHRRMQDFNPHTYERVSAEHARRVQIKNGDAVTPDRGLEVDEEDQHTFSGAE